MLTKCRSLQKWTKTLRLLFAVITAFTFLSLGENARAGGTIINGVECVPVVSLVNPTPSNAPIVYPLFNRLQIYWNGSDWIIGVYCSFPVIEDTNIDTFKMTLAVVDGQSLDIVYMCFGSYYSNSISCGPPSQGSGPGYFVNPPTSLPSGANTPFIWIGTTLTVANSPLIVRSITGFW